MFLDQSQSYMLVYNGVKMFPPGPTRSTLSTGRVCWLYSQLPIQNGVNG